MVAWWETNWTTSSLGADITSIEKNVSLIGRILSTSSSMPAMVIVQANRWEQVTIILIAWQVIEVIFHVFIFVFLLFIIHFVAFVVFIVHSIIDELILFLVDNQDIISVFVNLLLDDHLIFVPKLVVIIILHIIRFFILI
jgi:hypothetical protein